MGQVLSKARGELYDCNAITTRLRTMLQSAYEQVRGLKKHSTFLSQLAANTIATGIHCLSMRLTIAYYLLPPEERKFPRSENLENSNLYHSALFSDNVLAASVVVNSTIMNAKEGRIDEDGCLQCSYHGWSFDGLGSCTRIPQASSEGPEARAIRSPRASVAKLPTLVSQGLFFVWPDENGWEKAANSEPPMLPDDFNDPGISTVTIQRDLFYGYDTLMECFRSITY